MTALPELTIRAHGSSGIEILVKLSTKYNCVDFTVPDDRPIPVFISPWMQWEPAAMQDERLQFAYEIARRATAYEELLRQVADLQGQLRLARKFSDAKQKTIDTAFDMWKADRARAGMPEDFSDIHDWPPEMTSGYRGDE